MRLSRLSTIWRSIIIPIAFVLSASGNQLAALEPTPFQEGDIFASVSGGLVQRYDKNGNLIETLNTALGNIFTTGCAFDSVGNLYVTTFNGGNVLRFKGPDLPHTNLGPFGSGYSGRPESIVFDSLGNVYVGAVDGNNDILKFDALGNPLAQFNVATEDRGSDWIDLAADQRTMYYTSEGKYIWRYDVLDGVQLPLFNFSTPLPGSIAYALRILPDGGVIVADTELIVRLDAAANIVQTYDVAGENSWFSLNLDPDGNSFWAGNFGSGRIYKFDIGAGGAPLISIDTGVGSGRLWGICVYTELTSGLIDRDEDGLPDDYEVNGVDTNGDGGRDLLLGQLDEVGENVPPNPLHKDIYVWVDWLKGNNHSHKPSERALEEVKKAFAEAPVRNKDNQSGINLHIILGNEITETADREILGSITRTLAGPDYLYSSDEFAAIKREFFLENGTRPGKASAFHYALFAHLLPHVVLDCPPRDGNPTGIAPMMNDSNVGSDFIVGHQSLDRNNLWEVGGTFMHELGHTLDLGHGGPGILNDVNYKPNQLSVMNYSFQRGLLYRSALSFFARRSKLDYSRFDQTIIPDLNENSLDERIGLNGGQIIENYGTVYYRGVLDAEGITVGYSKINGPINWNGNEVSTRNPESSVQANINQDGDRAALGGCQEKYDVLRTYNEWAALNFEKGNIGTAAALIPAYPTETFIDVDNLDLDIDIQSVTDGTATGLESLLYMTERQGTLRKVNQTTGATTIVGNLGTDSIIGLSNRPGNATYIYGVEPTGFGGLGLSRLVRINRLTGQVTPLPVFDESILGISNPTAYGIAISPAAPDTAVITGVNTVNGIHYYLWKVNVNTGAVLGPAIQTTAWVYEMAYDFDGSVLYGVNIDGQLVTVNTDTGEVTLVGNPNLSSFIEGLAFRPSDGALFAIDGFDQDRLVRLNPADGSVLEIVGSLGVVGPNGLAFVPASGADTTGVFRPSNGLLYLKHQNTTGFADVAINYGLGGDYPVVGDWDGDGDTTIGIYRNGIFYLRNENTIGFADIVFPFGQPGDQPIAGDWDGDGIDTIGVYRSSTITFYLRNSNSTGTPDMSFQLGLPGDVGLAGDWNGDGFDTTGVFRPSNGVIFLKNTNDTGFADVALNYGLPGDKPIMGDWNNDGIDTIGIYRGNTFYLRNENTVGFADILFSLGNPGDMPIAGNWDGSIP